MNFLRLLWNVSEKQTVYIVILSVINGIASGMLLILYPNAVLDIIAGKPYMIYLFALPLTAFVSVYSKRLSQQKIAVLTEQSLEDMILKIADGIRHTELPEFEQYDPSEIHMTVGNAQAVTSAATLYIESLQNNAALFIAWFYIFAVLSPAVGLFILVWRIAFILFDEMTGKIIGSGVGETLGRQTAIFSIFQHHLYGFKELKFNRKKSEDVFGNYLVPMIESVKKMRLKTKFYITEIVIVIMLSNFLLIGACVFISSDLLVPAVTTVKIVIMLIYMLQLDIVVATSAIKGAGGRAALTQLERLFGKLSSGGTGQDLYEPSQEVIKKFDSLALENVRFAYQPPESNGQGFSVEIEKLKISGGEILFIVGGNGSGKSTLMNILTGLYPPDSGMIRIGGQPVSMADHRYLFSAVFTDFHLFDRLYGLDAPDEANVRKLLRLMDLQDKTRYRQGSFSTLDLSTGQKKRLALLTVLMEDKPVYVFDEWAADQDPQFRRYFYETLLPSFKAKGKTVIAITHDDHYFHVADRVIRMEYGRIVEEWCPEREAHRVPAAESSSLSREAETGIEDRKPVKRIPETSAKESPREAEKAGGVFARFRQVLSGQGVPVKKTVFYIMLVGFSMVGMMVTVLAASHLSPEQPVFPFFIQFVVLAVVFIVAFRRMNRLIYESIEDRISALQVKITDHVRKTDLQTLEQIGPGRIYTALTADIRTISDGSDTIMVCTQGAFRTVMIYIYLGFLYFPMTLMMLFLTGIGGLFYGITQSVMTKLFDSIRDQERKLFDVLGGLLKGFKELKLSNKKNDHFYHEGFRACTSEMQEIRLRFIRCYINNHTMINSLWQIALLGITLLLPFMGISSKALLIGIALMLTLPVQQVIERYSGFHQTYMSIRQLYAFENRMTGLSQEPAEILSPEFFEEIRYEQFAFTYNVPNGRAFSVGPLNLSFIPGEIVFITGGNGSGKSTLLKLLTGLYPPDTGQFFFDGNTGDIRLYREIFSVIFSEFHLFDRLYGMEEVDEARLGELLKLFHLEKKVRWADGKFSTLDLSTGQKKRLSLVVTMMEDKPVYIFDEWAADQDPQFRKYFYMTLLPEFKAQGKTVIAVTHDDRYFHVADRVIRMEYGQII